MRLVRLRLRGLLLPDFAFWQIGELSEKLGGNR